MQIEELVRQKKTKTDDSHKSSEEIFKNQEVIYCIKYCLSRTKTELTIVFSNIEVTGDSNELFQQNVEYKILLGMNSRKNERKEIGGREYGKHLSSLV